MMIEKPTNPGWAAGVGKRSDAERLAWALKGAPMRKKDLRLTPMGAMAEGRKLRERITALMTQKKLNPDNAMVFCVFAAPDLSTLFPGMVHFPVVDRGMQDLKMASDAARLNLLPIGFVVFVLDVDRDPEYLHLYGHQRPLIVEDPRVEALLTTARESYSRWIKEKHVGSN
jgi:hypothetical protein